MEGYPFLTHLIPAQNQISTRLPQCLSDSRFTYVLSPDQFWGSKSSVDNSWNGMVGMVHRKVRMAQILFLSLHTKRHISSVIGRCISGAFLEYFWIAELDQNQLFPLISTPSAVACTFKSQLYSL